MLPPTEHAFRWLRTIRHFPVASLWHRARLKVSRQLYKPLAGSSSLPQEWRDWAQANPKELKRLSFSFEHWQLMQNESVQSQVADKGRNLLVSRQGWVLNEAFPVPGNALAQAELIASKTPLWRENYGYLEWLRPLILQLTEEPSGLEAADLLNEANMLESLGVISFLEAQMRLYWSLGFRERTWSTYGVARRLLVYCELLPALVQCSEAFQSDFWRVFQEESHFLTRFLEWDVQGNHLVKNLNAWLAVALVWEKLPSTQAQGCQWLRQLSKILPPVFNAQVLPDGFHYERTPMYHVWVLQDLLDCLYRLRETPHRFDFQSGQEQLTILARRMLAAADAMQHSFGQLPMFGDSSRLQTPNLDALRAYAAALPGFPKSEPVESAVLNPDEAAEQARFSYLPDAGLAVFRHQQPTSSLILDCGDFGPRQLPAHSHCDIGSFELQIGDAPVLVDAGVSDYAPSMLRDYFRGTGAHNTLWVPGEEQAEIWGSFRVAEYPSVQPAQVEQDESGAKVTVSYENHNQRYEHQRSVYSVAGRFWVVQDWLLHLRPADRPCFSLLHVHPDCSMTYEDGCFVVGEKLLVIPFGAKQVEWADQSPWRQNLNLFSHSFNQARPGRLIAMAPKSKDCFGWVLAPFEPENRPACQKLGDSVELCYPNRHGQYRFTLDSQGLSVAFLGPGA